MWRICHQLWMVTMSAAHPISPRRIHLSDECTHNASVDDKIEIKKINIYDEVNVNVMSSSVSLDSECVPVYAFLFSLVRLSFFFESTRNANRIHSNEYHDFHGLPLGLLHFHAKESNISLDLLCRNGAHDNRTRNIHRRQIWSAWRRQSLIERTFSNHDVHFSRRVACTLSAYRFIIIAFGIFVRFKIQNIHLTKLNRCDEASSRTKSSKRTWSKCQAVDAHDGCTIRTRPITFCKSIFFFSLSCRWQFFVRLDSAILVSSVFFYGRQPPFSQWMEFKVTLNAINRSRCANKTAHHISNATLKQFDSRIELTHTKTTTRTKPNSILYYAFAFIVYVGRHCASRIYHKMQKLSSRFHITSPIITRQFRFHQQMPKI